MIQPLTDVGRVAAADASDASPAVEDRVRDFVVRTFLFGEDGRALDLDDSFLAAGILDSMGVLELVEFIERAFDIRVADADIVPENLDSIRRIARYVARRSGS